ncbi:hypothetical protein KY342_06695 [Candidatus Woesearchaeota archaeon]|nr:hypothetical protein [Candidatus Woesearchaeota archaeon]
MKAKKEAQITKAKKRKKTTPPQYYTKRNVVQFVGLKILDPFDQKRIKDLFYQHAIEIEREVKTINKIRVHFKEYEKGGRKKYSVQLLIDSPMRPITVNSVYSPVQWDPVAIVHKLIKKARSQIIHKFKTDTPYKKAYN